MAKWRINAECGADECVFYLNFEPEDLQMTPQEMRARRPLLASAPNVKLNTALWRCWRAVYAPLNIACAAIAGAHAAYFATRRKKA